MGNPACLSGSNKEGGHTLQHLLKPCPGDLIKLAHRLYKAMHRTHCTLAGIDDVTPRQKLKDEKALTLQRGYSACDQFIADFGKVWHG